MRSPEIVASARSPGLHRPFRFYYVECTGYVLFYLAYGFYPVCVNIDYAEPKIFRELLLSEYLKVCIVLVGEFKVQLAYRELQNLRIDARVIPVTDVYPDVCVYAFGCDFY